MKKGKLNNRGFVLVETLIVSVFVMGIFAILYNNFYPLMGEYEKREVYDDIDGKYAAYWIKRVVEHDSVEFTSEQLGALSGEADSAGYFLFDCSMVGVASMQDMCKEIVKQAQVMIDDNGTPTDDADDFPHIYITNYHLGDRTVEGAPNQCDGKQCGFKTLINGTDNSGKFTGGMHKYLVFLPDYKWDSLNNAKYRVFVEYHRTRDDNDYVAYSTFEVRK